LPRDLHSASPAGANDEQHPGTRIVPDTGPARWSAADAERYLLDLEISGMRFGLDRMRRLMTTLGHPELRYDTIHVVGTNGKSSTVRMIAAIIQEHGLRVGAYLSPHLVSFTERIRFGDRDIAPADFGRAVQRAAVAVRRVDRGRAPDDKVTQFEALTAGAYAAFVDLGAQVAVIEAGLGGGSDATNVIPSTIQVLTNVGLEHTRLLGDTVGDIAREKLGVVRDGATLVVGADLHPDALEEAHAAVARHGATLIRAPALPEVEIASPGDYQRRNFALAWMVASVYLGARLSLPAVRAAASRVQVPGRMQTIDERPRTVLDAAHNPAGVVALAESLPELADGRRLVVVVSILEDKDAREMLRTLSEHADQFVLTGNHNPRALSPAALADLAEQLGVSTIELEADPRRAVARARELAGRQGVVVATGSIYLIADLLRTPGSGGASNL